MAKKNYQHVDALRFPTLENIGNGLIRLGLSGQNTHRTKVQVTVQIPKYMLPSIVSEIARIAKEDAINAEAFLQRVKNSVQ